MATMRGMRSRLRVRGKEAARTSGRFRAGVQAEGIDALRERVEPCSRTRCRSAGSSTCGWPS